MGSKNCAETPRQKMISMMYLVLTALLALNVSKDILDAFIVVNDGIEETNRIFAAKVEGNYAAFEKAKAMAPEKVAENYKKAQEVKKLASDLVTYINNLKFEIIAKAEGITAEEAAKMPVRELTAKDNFDKPTHVLIGESNDGSAGKARELKNKIIDFKKKVNDLLGKYAKEVKLGLEVEKNFKTLDGDELNWEMTNFYHTILAADIVIFNKLVLEVRNAEADAVSTLLAAVSADDFTFDKIGAKVIPKSNYVLTGDEYEAEIFVAAYDSKQQPEITIGSDVDTVTNKVLGNPTILEGTEGRGIYKVRAGGTGIQKYGGIITVKSKSGSVSYPFRQEYFVAQPSATVSADKMNVFYIGVDNPVSISVPGVPNDKVRASITNGSLSPVGGGKYVVRVTGGAEATINVSAEMDKSSRPMGSMKFRVKKIPTPMTYVAGKSGGGYGKSELLASPYVTAVLENFDFDLRFNVVSYTFVYKNPAGDLIPKQGVGMSLTQEMKDLIQRSKRGDRFYVEDVKASGPDGTRALNAVSIKIAN